MANPFENKRRAGGKPFEKGNKIGHRFKPGESGNPGGRPKLDYSPARILEELARIAFVDTRKLFDENGEIIPVHLLDEDTARAIASLDHDAIKVGSKRIGTTTKLKVLTKTQALELLGKYHKLFTDKTEHTGADGEPLMLNVKIVKANGEDGGH